MGLCTLLTVLSHKTKDSQDGFFPILRTFVRCLGCAWCRGAGRALGVGLSFTVQRGKCCPGQIPQETGVGVKVQDKKGPLDLLLCTRTSLWHLDGDRQALGSESWQLHF